MAEAEPPEPENVTATQLRMLMRAIGPLTLLRRIPSIPAAVFALRRRGQLKKLRRLVRRLDAFDAIANLVLASTPMDPETYRESEFAESMAAPELVALAFAEENAPFKGRTSPGDLGALHDLAPQIVTSANLGLMFHLQRRSTATKKPEVVPRLKYAMVTRELHLRNARFYEEEVELLAGLFTGGTRAALVERLGFGYEEMQRLFDTVGPDMVNGLATRIVESVERTRQMAEVSRELRDVLDGFTGNRAEAIERIGAVEAFAQLSSIASNSFDDLLALTGIESEILTKLLSQLSIDLDGRNKGLLEGFLNGDNPFRTRPFVKRRSADGRDEWLLVQPTWLIYGMRELFESALTSAPMDQGYMKLRGRTLERRGLGNLVRALRPESALTNVEYVDQTGKRWETDGLIVVGDVAIIVEAKSNRLTPYARSGGPARLWSELHPIVAKAADQAERLRAVLAAESSLHIRSSTDIDAAGVVQPVRSNWDLDLEGIREVYTVALSLEDLNFLATITSDLVDSGLIDANAPAPWIVNIHDLGIVTEIVERPSELIHYLSRRLRASASNQVLANDELDYFMHYLTRGLYTDEPTDGIQMVASLTDPLDEWHAHKHGHRKQFAPKPAQPISRDLGAVLDLLDRHRPYGWLQASLALLELDEDSRDEVGGSPRALRAKTRGDRRTHSVARKFVPPKLAPFGVIVMSFERGLSAKQITRRFQSYAAARKYASRLDRAYAFGVWQGSSSAFDMFLCLDDVWELDDDLAALADGMGLAPDADS